MERVLPDGGDWWGNQVCGTQISSQSPIRCTREKHHFGLCIPECLSCGNDWSVGGCQCTATCGCCDQNLLIETEIEEGYCGYCLVDHADEISERHDASCIVRPVTDEELAETLKSLGVAPPMH